MNKDEYAIIIECKYAQGILIGRPLQNIVVLQYHKTTKSENFLR